MKLFLYILLIFNSLDIYSQSASLVISSPEDDLPQGSVVSPDDDLYLVSWRGTFAEAYSNTGDYLRYRNIIYHINEDILVVDSLEIDTIQGYDVSLRGVKIIGDSILVWGNALRLTDSIVYLALLWLEADLQQIDFVIYGSFSDSVLFISNTEDEDGNIIFAGYNHYTFEMFLIKTNSQGGYIYENRIPSLGFPFPNICYLPSIDKIMCGRGSWLGRIFNSDLTRDTIYFPPIFNDYFSFSFFRKYDSYRCILPGMILKPVPELSWNTSCILFDTAALVNDSIIFHLPNIQNTATEVDFIDNVSMFFGTVENTLYNGGDPYYFEHVDRSFALYRFNFQDRIIWEKHFGGDGNYESLHVSALNGGGCIFYGTYYDWRNNPEWERNIVVYKMDNNGVLLNIPENNKMSLNIYPNPANDKLIIDISEFDNYIDKILKIQLYNIQGEMLISLTNVTFEITSIDVSGLVPGMYILRFTFDHSSYSQKVIIK